LVFKSRSGGRDGSRSSDDAGLLRRGSNLLAEGKPEAAEKIFRAALEGFEDSAVTHALLAMALSDRNKNRQALGEAADAIALNPRLALAHAARACALEASGLPWDAEMECRQALALTPTDPNRHSDLAGVVARAGRHAEALEITARGLALNPQHVPSLRMRALTLAWMDRADEGQEVVAAALLEAPVLARLHACLGVAFEDRGDHLRAAEEFGQAAELDASGQRDRNRLRRLNSSFSRLTPSMEKLFGR
jgi:tetratricopeptide (TPR) repeat protein